MATSPRVTIGLPVYNGERFMAESIESILGQDFEDFELIISDNASTDATDKIARKFAESDARIRYVRNERNLGAARNYNQLVDMARGEYFKWAAHDDVCTPEFIAACVEVLDTDTSVVLAFPRAADIDENGVVVEVYPSLAYATASRASERARDVLRFESPCFESFGLTRRSVLGRTSRIGSYSGSDRTLFLELALLGRFHEVDELLFLHREHTTRSVHLYGDVRARNAWFDPDRASARTSPRWRLLREYTASIVRSPVSPSERARALMGIPPWVVRNRRTLSRELASRILRPLRPSASDQRTRERHER